MQLWEQAIHNGTLRVVVWHERFDLPLVRDENEEYIDTPTGRVYTNDLKEYFYDLPKECIEEKKTKT